jgi:dethiobiotin synthetase
LVCVVGTATDVGKTWVAARALALLRESGSRVAARKPVQSFDPGSDQSTDADVLAAATGEQPHHVCPVDRWYPLAMAPPMAAGELGRPSFTVDDLVSETRWPDAVDIGLVETVGGPRSPMASDGDSAAFCLRLKPDVIILVADSGLGAINAVRLAISPFIDQDIPTVVMLNRYSSEDRIHSLNREHLADRVRLQLATDPCELKSYLEHHAGLQA